MIESKLAGVGLAGPVGAHGAAHDGADIAAPGQGEQMRLAIGLVPVIFVEIGADRADFGRAAVTPREFAEFGLANPFDPETLGVSGGGVGHALFPILRSRPTAPWRAVFPDRPGRAPFPNHPPAVATGL